MMIIKVIPKVALKMTLKMAFKTFSNGTDSSGDSMVSFIAVYASIGIAME